jgi:hypothetical protein
MRLTRLLFIHVSTIHSAGVVLLAALVLCPRMAFRIPLGKTPERRASSGNDGTSDEQADEGVADPQPPLFTISSSSVFQLFKLDGRE